MNAVDFERMSRRMAAATSRRGLLRAFVTGLAAVAGGSLLGFEDAQASQPCKTEEDCPNAQRCLAGLCVASSAEAALHHIQLRPPSVGANAPTASNLPAASNQTGPTGSAGQTAPGSGGQPSPTATSPTASGAGNNAESACGRLGQPCCAGKRCGSLPWHYCDSDGICQTCSPTHQCNGKCCAPLEVCEQGVCKTQCGVPGLRCCTKEEAPEPCALGGLVHCVNGTCQSCGLPGQSCCNEGSPCGQAFNCIRGVCTVCPVPCGAGQNRTCCQVTETCIDGKCVACGLPTQACCPGNKCLPERGQTVVGCRDGTCYFCPGFQCGDTCCIPVKEWCDKTVCRACGTIGQPCCPDGTCGPLLTCVNGTCSLFSASPPSSTPAGPTSPPPSGPSPAPLPSGPTPAPPPAGPSPAPLPASSGP